MEVLVTMQALCKHTQHKDTYVKHTHTLKHMRICSGVYVITVRASSPCHQVSQATAHLKVNILHTHPKSTLDRLSAHADPSNNWAGNNVQYGNEAKQGFHNRPQNSYGRGTQHPCINSHHGRVVSRPEKSGILGLA